MEIDKTERLKPDSPRKNHKPPPKRNKKEDSECLHTVSHNVSYSNMPKGVIETEVFKMRCLTLLTENDNENGFEEAFQLLYRYHTSREKDINDLYKESSNFAPVPKSKNITPYFEPSQDAKKSDESGLIYTSRSGRQVKRKISNLSEVMSNFGAVKSRSPIKPVEPSSVSKRGKPSPIVVKSEDFVNLKKPTTSRKELFKAALQQEQENRIKNEKGMEKLEKSLATVDEEEPASSEELFKADDVNWLKATETDKRWNYPSTSTANLDKNLMSTPRRSSELPRRKSLSEKKTPSNSNESKRPKLDIQSSRNNEPSTSGTQTLRPEEENCTLCPICMRMFKNEQIEQHASTCGEM